MFEIALRTHVIQTKSGPQFGIQNRRPGGSILDVKMVFWGPNLVVRIVILGSDFGSQMVVLGIGCQHEVDRETPILGCGSESKESLVCDPLAHCILCNRGVKKGLTDQEGRLEGRMDLTICSSNWRLVLIAHRGLRIAVKYHTAATPHDGVWR